MARNLKVEVPGAVAVAPADEAAPAPAANVRVYEDVDPAQIPFGQSVLTDRGHVCSTAPDPRAGKFNR